MVAPSRPVAQSAPPDGAESDGELCSAPWFLISWRSNADIALAEPVYPSASHFGGWPNDPNFGGAEPSGQPHESINLPSFYPPWPPAASMAGPLVDPLQDFDFGSSATSLMSQGFNPSIFTHTSVQQQQRNANPRVPMGNHSLNNFEALPLFGSMGYQNTAGLTDLMQQDHLSSAAETTSVLSLSGTEEVGGA